MSFTKGRASDSIKLDVQAHSRLRIYPCHPHTRHTCDTTRTKHLHFPADQQKPVARYGARIEGIAREYSLHNPSMWRFGLPVY